MKREGDKPMPGKSKCRDDRIVKQEYETRHTRRSYQKDVQRRTQDIREVDEQLKQTCESIAARTEFSEAQLIHHGLPI